MAFAGARAPADEEVHATEAVEEPEVPKTCERYGQAAEDMVETRFPKPDPGPNARAYEGDGGYTGRGEVAEDPEPNQERARPAWLTDYSTHIGIIGVLSEIPASPPRKEAEPVERSPFDALMDSFSPVCAGTQGAHVEPVRRSREQERCAQRPRQMRARGRA